MSYSQKYCLVQPLDSMRRDDEFAANEWPPHVTIAGVFALDWHDDYFSEFTQLVGSHQPFVSSSTSVEHFGPQREVNVRLIELNENLQTLHRDIATFILEHGGAFNDPQYHFDGFRPHVTMRGNEPTENLEITFDSLALIDMFPNRDHTRRKVIKLFEFSQN